MNSKQNESRLVYEVMQGLGEYGAVFRTNSGTIRLPSGATFKGLPKGFSDILFIQNDGKPCFIECKIGKNKPTQEQIAFIEKMRRLNCKAGVCYNVSEALALCELPEEKNRRIPHDTRPGRWSRHSLRPPLFNHILSLLHTAVKRCF